MGKNNGSNNGNDNKCIQPLEFVCQTESEVYELPYSTLTGLLVSSDGCEETSLYSAVFGKHQCCFTESYIMTIEDGRKTYDFICHGPHPDDSAYKPVVVDGDVKIRDCVLICPIERLSDDSYRRISMGKAEKAVLDKHIHICITRNTHKFPNGACGSGYPCRCLCIKDVKIAKLKSTVCPGDVFCSIE